MATMADVARRAGVSVATVSHVLNGTRAVLPHTRRAVQDAVEALGYTRNTLARSLVTSRTRSIGLAVSAISNPYFTEILQGVEAAALEHGYSLLVADPHDDPAHELRAARLLHERRVDGVIVAPSPRPHALVDHLTRHGVPAVFLDRLVAPPSKRAPDDAPRHDGSPRTDRSLDGDGTGLSPDTPGLPQEEPGVPQEGPALPHGRAAAAQDGPRLDPDAPAPAQDGQPFDQDGQRPDRDGPRPVAQDGPPFDQVCAENTEPTARLVTHLAGLGHRRIAMVAGLPGLSTTDERIAGYRHGLAAAGLPFDERLLVHGDSESAGGERATAHLLASGVSPTALVTANNAMTIGALRALRTHGLTVPDDLALCCFDDFSWADLFSPRLTAIAQPSREMGIRAVEVLLDRLADPDAPARTVRLPCTFVHRSSCGCPDGPEERTPAGRPRSSRAPGGHEGGASRVSPGPSTSRDTARASRKGNPS
ncbi:LacI family DNA-binding transcriptional regulator [Streptomyces sp. bgisy022]|uniref:LacI family DNA-binding transcriptional regulator n=1 Tax=Streptomyces sp. bgisy022 TaxID=3413769 RepID=UPI003D74B645